MTAINPHEKSATGDSRVLPVRPGPRPQTTPWAPHIQHDQNAPAGISTQPVALAVAARGGLPVANPGTSPHAFAAQRG